MIGKARLSELAKVDAFLREFKFANFPLFARGVLNGEVRSVRVSRIDEDFLGTVANESVERMWLHLFSRIWSRKKVMIIDRGGKWIANDAGRCDRPTWRFRKDSEKRDETVFAIMNREKIWDKAHYVLTFNPLDGELVLYKPPKQFTLLEWIEEQKRRAREVLSEELALIDSEADRQVASQQ